MHPISKKNKHGGQVKDITGNIYGRLEAIEHIFTERGTAYWVCVCSCGKYSSVTKSGVSLRRGMVISCGCLHEKANGESKIDEYHLYKNMLSRCNNPDAPNYERYGGRGIRVCERWSGKGGLLNFLEDVGKRPSKNHQIDRIDNDGNYEPGNVRWSTPKQQANNRRNNRREFFRGKERTISEILDTLGISDNAQRNKCYLRLRGGWSIKEMLKEI